MMCRWCREECPPRWGLPGYVNEHVACRPERVVEPEPWRASQAVDPEGLEWELVRDSERRRLDRAESSMASGKGWHLAARQCQGLMEMGKEA